MRARFIFAALASIGALQGQPKISIERLALHQFEDGPLLPLSYEFVPGETAYFSCRIAGYKTVEKNDEKSVHLAWQMRVSDPSGVPLEKEKSTIIAERVLPQDKDWIPKFLASFVIPEFALSGTYHISVTINDQIAGTQITGDLPFHVRGHDVELSRTLVTRGFQFLQSENDTVAMRSPVYRPGSMLWAKFDITGYKFGNGNRFSVEYGLAILNAAGDQLFSQPQAAATSNASFYPQRYVPGVLSLHLDPNVATGAYTLVVTVRDKIGNQTWETRQPFQVQ